MTIVISRNVRVHYRFEGEKGAYLLLHHGLFGSSRDWYEAGYVDALRDDFRLIVMDARGHGRSDHPLEPQKYALSALADDVIAIMDELEIRNLHFCGYSLGALVGFELLMRHPERMRIVMLAGETPFLSTAMQDEWRALSERVRAEGLAAVRERLVADGRLVATAAGPEQEGEQPAALALLEALATEPIRPDDGRLSVDSPVALFTGEDDPALERMRDARRRIHRARFVSFPGQHHAGLFHERTALMAEMLRLLRPAPRQGEGADPGDSPRDERPSRGQRGGRGRGRGGRGRDEGPRASAPLTPPPPVDVPGRGAPPAEPTSDASPDAERGAASGYTALEPPAAPAGPAADAAPESPPPEPQRPAEAEAAPAQSAPVSDAPPQEAPDDIGVRARLEEDEEDVRTAAAPAQAEDGWVDPEELAPELGPRTGAPGAEPGGEDEDEGEWGDTDEDEPRRP